MAESWSDWIDGELAAVRGRGQWRAPRVFDGRGVRGQVDGRLVVTYASNDYLGLTGHPAVVAAAAAAATAWGTGSGASRLVVGSRPVHDELEQALAAWKGAERALHFSTGYAANLSVLTTLGGPGAGIVSDELNHASLIDGCRMSRSRTLVSRHTDVDHVDRLLGELTAGGAERLLVATDAVFSMDGVVAPVDDLLEVCARHGALLVVDEAHTVLDDPVPAGPVAAPLVRVGTLSKALGAVGGFVAAEGQVVDLLVNRARPYIFSTAPTPADTAAALAALGVLRSAEGAELVARLRRSVDRLRPGHPSPILPVVIGPEDDTLAASAALLEQGIHIPAIRPPTVPVGTSRLRVALSAEHTDEMLDDLVGAVGAVLGPDALAGGGARAA